MRLHHASLALLAAILFVPATLLVARADTLFTSPQPTHLKYEVNYNGLKAKFVSDLWLVVEKNGDGSHTVKLTGWGYLKQTNTAKKVWEDKRWTPLSVTARARNGVITHSDEAGFRGLKLASSVTVDLNARIASHQVSLLVCRQPSIDG